MDLMYIETPYIKWKIPWELCKGLGFDHRDKRSKHKSEAVIEDDKVSLWDCKI